MNPEQHPENSVSEAALTGSTLYPWDTGVKVAELQELLRAHGFTLRVDGDFGRLTEDAVKAFQSRHKIRVDGIVGEKTWAALKGTVRAGTRLLRRGHTGEDVRELQGLLRVHGLESPRNGVFCRQTKDAVVAFQRKCKLQENGIVDQATWMMLRNTPSLPTPPRQTGWFINQRKWW
jgi:peptidoglycan hydrolase-like protein with peptidoglycan-binding domain